MPNYPFAAVLFDMDGTLIDNVPLHQAVWREFTQQHGLHFSEEQLSYAIGRKATEVVKHFFSAATPEEAARLTAERQDLYRARLASSDLVHVVAGAEEFLAQLGRIGVARVLATDAPRANVDAVFRKFDLAHYFEKVVTSDQIHHGKPDPEIFLTAAASVGVDPARCLVAEDSVAGITAAKAAKCACVGLSTTLSAAELRHAGADFTAVNFLTLPKPLVAPNMA